MPFDKGFRLNDPQRTSPVKELAERNHYEAIRRSCSPWFNLALPEQRELLSEKKILCNKADSGVKEQTEEGQQLRILQCVPRRIEFLRRTTVAANEAATRRDIPEPVLIGLAWPDGCDLESGRLRKGYGPSNISSGDYQNLF